MPINGRLLEYNHLHLCECIHNYLSNKHQVVGEKRFQFEPLCPNEDRSSFNYSHNSGVLPHPNSSPSRTVQCKHARNQVQTDLGFLVEEGADMLVESRWSCVLPNIQTGSIIGAGQLRKK